MNELSFLWIFNKLIIIYFWWFFVWIPVTIKCIYIFYLLFWFDFSLSSWFRINIVYSSLISWYHWWNDELEHIQMNAILIRLASVPYLQYSAIYDTTVQNGRSSTHLFNIHKLIWIFSYQLNVFVDVNECSSGNGGCEHLCENTVGSYVCKCPSGYRLSRDGRQCDGTEIHSPTIIIVNLYAMIWL